ncbi:ABC transporter permease, partial [Streptomyces sp. ISL-36]|nr:ABC transporter permease [Streptomyces sp. ISL-36]
ADARDRAALRVTGADARVAGDADAMPLPDGLAEAVRGSAGVRDVTTFQIEYGIPLPAGTGRSPETRSTPLIGVEPESYHRIARRTGFGAFPAGLLKSTGTGGRIDPDRVLPAVASPGVAARLGTEPQDVTAAAGSFKVRIVAVRTATPALPGGDFLLVNGADLTNRADTALLASGPSVDGDALRRAVAAKSPDFSVVLRAERRALYVDSP